MRTRENAVARCRRTPALNMPQDANLSLKTHLATNLFGKIVGPTGVLPFGRHENTARFTARHSPLDVLDRAVYTREILRNEGLLSAAGQSDVDGDESGIATHHLDDEQTVVAGGRVADTVDGVQSRVDGRIVANRCVVP